jgi:peroxiredoxin
MKIRSVVYSVIASILVLASCKDESAFKLSGTVKNPDKIKKVYLLVADSVQINVIDSVALSSDGKFEFKHTAPYANLYKLRIGGAIYDLIAKNGDMIEFTTDQSDKMHGYEIKGSENSEKIQEFNKLSNYWGDKNGKIVEEYQGKVEKLGKESDSLVAIYRPLFMKNMEDYANAVLKFVDDNKTSLAAFYAMSSLEPMKYEQQMVAYADGLKDKNEFSDNPGVQRFIHQMMQVKPTSIGHKAPDFTTAGLDGKPVSLASYKGKYVMLDFWASWCAPCRAENPNVVKAYAAFKDKGFNILGISLDVTKEDWQKAIAADKLTWAHASDLQRFDGPTERLYHIEAIPTNYIIDPQGVIVAKNITGSALEDFLNKTFNKPI